MRSVLFYVLLTIEGAKVKSVTVTVADFVEFTPYEFIKQ